MQGQAETLPSGACWGNVCSSLRTEPPPCSGVWLGQSGWLGLGEPGDLLLSEAGRLRAPHSRLPACCQGECCGGAPHLQGLRPHGVPSSGLLETGLPCGDTWIRHLPSRTERGNMSPELRAADLGRKCPPPLRLVPKVILGPRSQMVDSGLDGQ